MCISIGITRIFEFIQINYIFSAGQISRSTSHSPSIRLRRHDTRQNGWMTAEDGCFVVMHSTTCELWYNWLIVDCCFFRISRRRVYFILFINVFSLNCFFNIISLWTKYSSLISCETSICDKKNDRSACAHIAQCWLIVFSLTLPLLPALSFPPHGNTLARISFSLHLLIFLVIFRHIIADVWSFERRFSGFRRCFRAS